jgi:hypothetical protein
MAMARKVRWEEMLPDELLGAIDACPVCHVAYGLAEPHGACNALGLDWLKAYALCGLAAQMHGGGGAPPCGWHVQEARTSTGRPPTESASHRPAPSRPICSCSLCSTSCELSTREAFTWQSS